MKSRYPNLLRSRRGKPLLTSPMSCYQKNKSPLLPIFILDITIDGRPIKLSKSATRKPEIVVALSLAVLLSIDMQAIGDFNKYEHFAYMMQNSIMSMQHAHAIVYKAELMKKDLLKKTQEATDYLHRLNQVETARAELLDRCNLARRAEQKAEAEAKASVEKAAKAETALVEAFASKDAEIKIADEKVYAEGQADVKEQYKKQVS